jgi:hypothetical protein
MKPIAILFALSLAALATQPVAGRTVWYHGSLQVGSINRGMEGNAYEYWGELDIKNGSSWAQTVTVAASIITSRLIKTICQNY